MKEKVLLVQFRTDKSATLEQKSILKLSGLKKDSIKIINPSITNCDLTDAKKIMEGITKVILGGSGEFYLSQIKNKDTVSEMIKKISPLLKYILKNDIPTLGICFGHQLLGYFLEARIVQDKSQEEIGSYAIELKSKSSSTPLFRGVPKNFIAQCGHKDSIESLPKHCILLANSKKCKVQAFRHKNNIYGVQFHPEMTKNDMLIRAKLYPNYKISNIEPSPHASKIIKNFCRNI